MRHSEAASGSHSAQEAHGRAEGPQSLLTGEAEARRRAMSAFAIAPTERMEAAWARIAGGETAHPVRGPEVGLVMLRGRMGGGGAAFNLGEASVTRATVRLAGGEIGHAMVLGRDAARTSLAASFDAAWQRPGLRDAIEAEVIAPTLSDRDEDDRRSAEETEATRVDFFTVARGED